MRARSLGKRGVNDPRLELARALVLFFFLLLAGFFSVALALRSRALRSVFDRLTGRPWGAFQRIFAHPGFVLWTGALVVSRWLLICGLTLLLFGAVGHAPGLLYVVAATAVGRILSLLPVSIGGVGLKEPPQIAIYALDGVPAEVLIAVSLLGLVTAFLLAGLYPLLVPLRAPAAAESAE